MASSAYFSNVSQSFKSSFEEWVLSEYHIASRPKHSIVEVRTGYNPPITLEATALSTTATIRKPRTKARTPRSVNK